MKQFLFLSAALFIKSLSFSQPGTADLSFGSNGFVYNKIYGIHYAVAQQPDGKLVTTGSYQAPLGNVARFLPDGAIDSSFGVDGFAGPGGDSYDMILQQDGKILTVGSYLTRLKPDGTLDSSFGKNGIATLPDFGDISVYGDIKLETNGSIIIAGYGINTTDPNNQYPSYSTICHLFTDGTFDYSFGTDGRVLNTVGITPIPYGKCLAIQSDGKILLGGYDNEIYYDGEDYVLSRYNPDGSIDNSFGSGGTVITQGVEGLNGSDAPCGIVLQPDGKIVVGGTSAGYNFITYMAALRYNTDGTLDNSFGTEGRAFIAYQGLTPDARAILLQPDGKLILTGDAFNFSGVDDFAIGRLNPDGSIDSSFGVDGTQLTAFKEGGPTAYCATLQQDGKIVQGGSYYNDKKGYDSYLLVRYNNDSKGQNQLLAKIKRFLHNHGIGWQGLDANINYYSVQYSKTGSNFTEKGKVSGAGSSRFTPYEFAVADAGYYRIVAVDRKGYKTFSNKVMVSEADMASAASVFPNPAKDYVTVQGLKTNETANISIADGSGNVMSKGVSNGAAQYRSPLTNMQPGTYYLNITTASKTEVLKFVKE